jgi:hypothetical protein
MKEQVLVLSRGHRNPGSLPIKIRSGDCPALALLLFLPLWSTTLWGGGLSFSFIIKFLFVELLGRGISPWQGRYVHTG